MPATSIGWIETSWAMDRRLWEMNRKSRDIDKQMQQEHGEKWVEVYMALN